MSEWISVETRLPPEEDKINSSWFDVYTEDNERKVDVKFRAGKFMDQIEDYRGDYSHEEEISGVTHWMLPVGPPCEL